MFVQQLIIQCWQFVKKNYGFMFTSKDTGVEFLLTQCFYHDIENKVEKRKFHILRIIYSMFFLLTNVTWIIFKDAAWTVWIGNYEKRSDAVSGLWRYNVVAIVLTYTILQCVYFFTSTTSEYKYIMKLCEELCTHHHSLEILHLPKNRKNSIRRRVTWILRILLFPYILAIISLYKTHLKACLATYGLTPGLVVGVIWVTVSALWVHFAVHAVIGAVAMVYLINTIVQSQMDHEIEQMDDDSISYKNRLVHAVSILSGFRKCMHCLTFYFLLVVSRPVVVLGFQFGTILMAMMKGSKAPIDLIMSSGLNLVFWMCTVMISSANSDSKARIYVSKLSRICGKLQTSMTFAEQLRVNVILNGCHERNSFTLLGHDVTSYFFLSSILFIMSNVLMIIDLLKDM